MNKKFFITIIALLFVVYSGFSQEWITIKSLENGFRADYPSQPKESSKSVSTAVGELALETIMLDLSTNQGLSDNLIYSVVKTEYPLSYFENGKVKSESLLNNAVNGAIGNVNGSVEFKKDVLFNGYPGKEIKVFMQEHDAFMYMNFYLVINKLYMLQVACFKNKDNNREINKFFKSFELINVKQ